MKHHQELDAMAFPTREFNYGGNGVVSISERERRVKDMKERWVNVQIPDMDDIFPEGFRPSRYKKMRQFDEAVVQDAKDSKEWMRRLIDAHPPSPEFSLVNILQEATKMQPMRTISDTILWKDVVGKLKAVLKEGCDLHWADNATTQCHLPSLESFEMIRIYGDAYAGFGTWPASLKERLYQVGAGWVCVPAEDRIIPLYWKHYCDANKIQYKEAISGHNPDKALSSSPLTSLPDLNIITQHLLKRKDEVDFELEVLIDPWNQKIGDFRRASDKDDTGTKFEKLRDNVALLVNTVNRKFKHDTSMLKHLCEATKLDTLLDKSFVTRVQAIVAEIQGESATKKDLQGLIKNEELGKHVNTILKDHYDDNETVFGKMHQEVSILKDTIREQNQTINDLNDKLNSETIKLGELEANQAQMQSALEDLKSTRDSQRSTTDRVNSYSPPPFRPYRLGSHLKDISSIYTASPSLCGESQDFPDPFSKVPAPASADSKVQGSSKSTHGPERSDSPVRKRRKLVSRREYHGPNDATTTCDSSSPPLSIGSDKCNEGEQENIHEVTKSSPDRNSKAGAGASSMLSTATFAVSPSVLSSHETTTVLCEKGDNHLFSEIKKERATTTPGHTSPLLSSGDDASDIL